MLLSELSQNMNLTCLTPELMDAGVTAGYASDLLSDVLAYAPEGGVLVTVQTHMNVIAVALRKRLSAVIFAGGNLPENAVVRKAVEENIRLLASESCAFDIAGRLYALGVRGVPAVKEEELDLASCGIFRSIS